MGMARVRSRSPLRKAFAPPETFLEKKKAQKTQKCSGCTEEGTSWVHMGPARDSTTEFWNQVTLDAYINWEKAWYDWDDNALFVPFCGGCMNHMHSTLVKQLKWMDVGATGEAVAMSSLAEQLVFKRQQLPEAAVEEAAVEDGVNMTDL